MGRALFMAKRFEANFVLPSLPNPLHSASISISVSESFSTPSPFPLSLRVEADRLFLIAPAPATTPEALSERARWGNRYGESVLFMARS